MSNSVVDYLLFTSFIGGSSVWGFFSSFGLVREARMMENMPTSKIRSAAQGYVELDGRAREIEDSSTRSPLSSDLCVWWGFTVEHYEQRGKNKQWVTVEKGISTESFYLEDATGRCRVDPAGAEVVPAKTFVWKGFSTRPKQGSREEKSFWGSAFGGYRYTEKLIYDGNPLYALGEFKTLRAEPAPQGPTEQQVGERMVQWKSDPQRMKLFDTNHDGVVDAKEWMAARRVAQAQLAREFVPPPPSVEETEGAHTLHKSGLSDQPFLLSTEGQDKLCGEYRTRAFMRLVLSIAGFVVTVFLVLAAFFKSQLAAWLPH